MTSKYLHKEVLASYIKLIDLFEGVELKGATMPYTSANGNMYSFLNKEGRMGLRLSSEDMKQFIKKYDTINCVENGATMKEYVYVPDHILERINSIKPWFEKSRAYVSTLKKK